MHQKVFSLADLAKQLYIWRLQSKKIVFTNGCFDILHLGHLRILQEAKRQGHKLIVGVNSDASVKRLKGATRPVKEEQTRASILASLLIVDAVVIFAEDTPYTLIEAIEPDVLVKGGDYTKENIVGGDLVESKGGEVVIVPYMEGVSSTNLIKKMNG